MCPGSDSISVAAVLNHAVGDYAAQSSNHIPEPAMSKSAFLTARIEPKLKARASRVLAKVGVSTTDAITMFLRQVVLRGGLPFDVRAPNSVIGTANEELEADRRESLHDRTRKIFNGVVRSRKKRRHENGLHDTRQTEC
jgi:addiction module RelB/DinJ family antitoxin